MLQVYIGSYLKSVLRYKYIILFIIRTLCVSKDVTIFDHFSKSEGGPRAKKFWKQWHWRKMQSCNEAESILRSPRRVSGTPSPDETLGYGYFGQATTASTSILCSLLYQTRKHCSRSGFESADGKRATLIQCCRVFPTSTHTPGDTPSMYIHFN